MAAVSKPDYNEFCDTTVASAKKEGDSHYTVDFRNGTGIVYPDCSATMAEYAYLDGNGLTVKLIYSIGYQNSSVSYNTLTPEPTSPPHQLWSLSRNQWAPRFTSQTPVAYITGTAAST